MFYIFYMIYVIFGVCYFNYMIIFII